MEEGTRKGTSSELFIQHLHIFHRFRTRVRVVLLLRLSSHSSSLIINTILMLLRCRGFTYNRRENNCFPPYNQCMSVLPDPPHCPHFEILAGSRATLHFCSRVSLASVHRGQMRFHFLAFDRAQLLHQSQPPCASLPFSQLNSRRPDVPEASD